MTKVFVLTYDRFTDYGSKQNNIIGVYGSKEKAREELFKLVDKAKTEYYKTYQKDDEDIKLNIDEKEGLDAMSVQLYYDSVYDETHFYIIDYDINVKYEDFEFDV